MIKRFFFVTTLFVLIAVLVFLSYLVVNFIGEKYLFDKLFYKKSMKFGYVGEKKPTFSDYGNRAKDLNIFIRYLSDRHKNNIIASFENKEKQYTVVVIGDSYVWGEGILEDDRFARLLEKKLNTVKKTRVISLGAPGDNIVDSYIKVSFAGKVFGPVDLYLIELLNNDLFLHFYPSYYDEKLSLEILSKCKGEKIEEIRASRGDVKFSLKDYDNALDKSYDKKSKNICVFESLVDQFPQEKVLYFDPDTVRFGYLRGLSFLKEEFAKRGARIITFEDTYAKSYSQYPKKLFSVSEKDGHPSSLANKMYADSIFDVLVTNPRWGFIK